LRHSSASPQSQRQDSLYADTQTGQPHVAQHFYFRLTFGSHHGDLVQSNSAFVGHRFRAVAGTVICIVIHEASPLQNKDASSMDCLRLARRDVD
jgi:hypothetical protein